MSSIKRQIIPVFVLIVLSLLTFVWNGCIRLSAKDIRTPSVYAGTITCSLWFSTNGVGRQFTDPSQCEVFINNNDLKVTFISSIDQRSNTTTQHSVVVKADSTVLMKLGAHIFRFRTDDPRVEVDVDLKKRRLRLKLVEPLAEEGSDSFLIKGSYISADEP